MHDDFCDEQHTPRQSCNDALRPPAPEPAPIAPEMSRATDTDDAPAAETAAAHADRALTIDETRRESVTVGGPSSTTYVRREWEKTVAGVERSAVFAADAAMAEEAPTRRVSARVAKKIALAAGGIAVVAVVAFVLRDRIGADDVVAIITDVIVSDDDDDGETRRQDSDS